MKNIERGIAAAIACALAALLMAVAVQAKADEPYTKEFHQVYQMSATGEVSLENINGSVQITGWDRNEVKVDAIERAGSQETLDRLRIQVNASPGDVSIKTEFPHDWSNHHGNWQVNYTVMVPKRAALDKINLVNGAIVIRDISGDVSASSVNGPVNASELSGAVRLSAVNGPVKAAFAGSVSGTVELSSVNGSVTVALPPGVQGHVSAHTINGSINTAFGLQVSGHLVGHSVDGTIGGGGNAQINLRSVNGSIHIEASSQEVE